MMMTKLLPLLLLVLTLGKGSRAYNDFPSLMTANATMAVIIEKGFFKNSDDYQLTIIEISEVINNVVRRNVKLSGIAIALFEDTSPNLGRDYTILFSIATCSSTWRLFREAQKEKLVHLALTDPDCPRLPDSGGISLPVINPGQELPQIFLDLRISNALAWPRVNVIHDDTFATSTISRVVKALSVDLPDQGLAPTARSLFSVSFDRNEAVMKERIRRILSDFHVDLLGNCFMVIINVDMVMSVMRVAKALKMVNPGSQWLYVLSEGASKETNVTSFHELLAEGENVAFIFNASDIQPDCNMGVMCHVREMTRALALSVESSLRSELELYNRVTEEEFEVIRLSKSERKEEIINNIRKELLKMRTTTEGMCGECLKWKAMTALTWGASFAQRNKTETQKEHEEKGIFMDVGIWSPGPGVAMYEPIFPHISQGFRGMNLPVSTFHNPPWQIIKYSNSGSIEYGGLVFDILNYLSLKLNFTYTVVLPATSDATNASVIDPNSTSSKFMDVAAMSVAQKTPPEIIELVRAKKVFLAASALTVTLNQPGINYTAPISTQNYALLSARPKALSRVFLFTAPFTGETWICLSSTLLIIGPALYLMIKLSPKPKAEHEAVGLDSTWQCTWYAYGALLQQGGMNLPSTDSARLVVGTWWLVIMVIVATYSGNLIAFLTFPRIDNPIENLNDLIDRKFEYTWAYPNGSAFEGYLEAAAANDDEKYKEILEGAGKVDPLQPNKALDRIKRDKLILIDWKSSLAFLMRNDLINTSACNFHVSADDFMFENLAMIINADSPYITLVNEAIKRMHESGLINKWLTEKMPMKDKCWESASMNQEATNHKVDMSDMQGIFYVLAIGFLSAAFVISSEFFWHKRKITLEKNFIRPFVS